MIATLPLNQIICGDCVEVMKGLPDKSVDLVYTDPVWPNSLASLPGAHNPYELFAAAMKEIARITSRLVVHLGCTSDPRFLLGVPSSMKYLRTCWLRYSFPSRRGRILIGSDVAYAFGEPPKSQKGHHLLPGECGAKNEVMIIKIKQRRHPTPRKIEHVKWIIDKFSLPGETVLDPFCGGGTAPAACKELGRNFIGIDIKDIYCDYSRIRLMNVIPDMFLSRKDDK